MITTTEHPPSQGFSGTITSEITLRSYEALKMLAAKNKTQADLYLETLLRQQLDTNGIKPTDWDPSKFTP